MLDVKAIRDDPEPFRAGLARRGTSPTRSTSCSPLTSVAARSRRASRSCAPSRTARRRRSAEPQGDEKQTLIDEVGGGLGGAEGAGAASSAEAEAELAELLARDAERSRTRARPNGFTDEDAVEVISASASRPRSTSSPGITWRSASCSACSTPSAVRARSARGSSTCWATGVRASSRSCATRSTSSCDKGFVPVIPPVLVREEAMYGTRVPADRRGEHLRHDARTTSTSSAPPRCRSPRSAWGRSSTRRTCRFDSAGLLDVLPSRGGHLRQGHGRHVPRAPVRQGRDVQLHARPRTPGTSTSSSCRSRRRSWATSRSPTGS